MEGFTRGSTTIMVQYWRSFDLLHAYARMRDAEHLTAWAEFNQRIVASGDVGIWHETYLVAGNQYEAVYNNMPEFGLAKAGGWCQREVQTILQRGDWVSQMALTHLRESIWCRAVLSRARFWFK